LSAHNIGSQVSRFYPHLQKFYTFSRKTRYNCFQNIFSVHCIHTLAHTFTVSFRLTVGKSMKKCVIHIICIGL